jgi:hypothetical protein
MPMFSKCVQHTVFVLIPFVFLALTALIVRFQLKQVTKKTPLPWTLLLVAKFVGF